MIQFDYPDAGSSRQVNGELIQMFIAANFKFFTDAIKFRFPSPPGSPVTIRVFDPPSVPLGPIMPNRMHYGALGLVMGLLVGVLLEILFKWDNPKPATAS